MRYQTKIVPRTLHFKQPAGTSRGVYATRNVWYVLLEDKRSGKYGVGECAPLPALSCDGISDYEDVLRQACLRLEHSGVLDKEALRNYPSMLFGLETALQHLHAGSLRLWDTPFSRGEAGIPVNGLIWMGAFDKMLEQVETKMKNGFRCIKLKIGAIGFDDELRLIKHIRERFPAGQVELRVDANGAFTPEDAPRKIEQLAAWGLHSIEQPIRAGQWKEMAKLCASTPLPIALDEELIGCNEPQKKQELIDAIRPQYIILKPSLHGGIHGSEEWIRYAGERNVAWWVTSALESNIGLNALAQWCAALNTRSPQGLGTGLLFADNIDYPLHMAGDCLCYRPQEPEPDIREILSVKQQ